MNKEYNYTVNTTEELSAKMAEVDNELREEFKKPTYKLSHKVFSAAAKCYENPKEPAEKAAECAMKAFEPLGNYERDMQTAWKSELSVLRPCLDRCNPTGDKACYSKCFNTFVSNIHTKLYNIHKSFT